MSVKLIIWIPGKPNIHGHKRREFLWVPAFSCYLYEGKEIEPSAFNAKYEKAMKNNGDMLPRVKVIETASAESAAPISTPATPSPVSAPNLPPPTLELTITEQLEKAEAVIERYAPERLKKKPGAKPQPAVTVEV